MGKIKVFAKEVYGKVLWYPNCEKSEFFAKLTNTKTFNLTQIRYITYLGFNVEIKRIDGKIVHLKTKVL